MASGISGAFQGIFEDTRRSQKCFQGTSRAFQDSGFRSVSGGFQVASENEVLRGPVELPEDLRSVSEGLRAYQEISWPFQKGHMKFQGVSGGLRGV